MERLAWITFVDDQGQDVGIAACDIALLREHPNGSVVTTRTGQTIISQSTVAQMATKIDTLWDEYNTALGDPA